MNQVLAWRRMAMRVIKAARAWHLEKCHGNNWFEPAWNATAAERELFAAVSDLWAEMYTLDRAETGSTSPMSETDGRRRRSNARMTERLHHDA